MGLDKDDTIVKRRMAQKMQFLAEDVAAAREPTTDELRSLVREEQRQVRAARAALSFRHLYFCLDRRGQRARDDAAQALAKLAGQPRGRQARFVARRPVHVPGLLRRPHVRGARQGVRAARLRRRLSRSSRPGSWQGPIESGYGWHLVFVDRRRSAGPHSRLRRGRADVKTAWLADQKERAARQGVQGDARQVHGGPACASRQGIDARARLRRGRRSRSIGRGAAVSGCRSAVAGFSRLLLALLVVPAAHAHEARPAYLEMKETAPGRSSVLWRTPVLVGHAPAGRAARFRTMCRT